MSRNRLIALALALSVGSAGTVEAQRPTREQGKREQEKNRDRDRDKNDDLRDADDDDDDEDRRGGRSLLKGVKLSEAQKTQLKAINQRYAVEEKAVRAAMKVAQKDARDARQRGDSLGARIALQRVANERAKVAALHQRELADIRATLTADQQRVFDANVAQMKTKMDKRDGKNGDNRRGKRGSGRPLI